MNLRTGALLLVLGVLGATGLAAATAGAVRDRFDGVGDDDEHAVALLHRSAHAMRATSYSGTRMLSAWGRDSATTVLVDVEHVAGQGTRLTLRGGGVPEETATFLASGGVSTHSGELSLESFHLLTDSYAVTLGPADSVAGRPATVVEVSRGGDVVARLWVDDGSGLLLRREVFDSAGRLVRESTFIDLSVHASGFMAHLPPTAPEPASHGIAVSHRHAMEVAGWDCPQEAGPMRLVGIETLQGSGAVHMTYSDGLTRMSVFEQHGSLDPGSVSGLEQYRLGDQVVHVREGLPTYAMWEKDGLVFTAVTDGSLDSVARVVATEPPGPSGDLGFWDRVAGGLTRIGAWSSPLV